MFNDFAFDLMVSTIIVLMFAAPYMVPHAFALSDAVMAIFSRGYRRDAVPNEMETSSETLAVVIGLGPAGQQVVPQLKERGITPVVIDINPRCPSTGRELGVDVHLGDAASEEVLMHAGVMNACMVVVTLPDPNTAVGVVEMVKKMRPALPVTARCRYHRHVDDMQAARAQIVIDEETGAGRKLGESIIAYLHTADDMALACRLAGRPTPSAPSGQEFS